MIDPLLPHAQPPDSSRTLRQFAGLWMVFFGVLAAWQGLGRGNEGWAWALGGTGLVVGLVGLVRPAAIRPIFKGALKLAFPVGWLVSNLLLTLLFFLLFVPIGLLSRLVGRDPLRLRRPQGTETYLTPRTQPAGIKSYFRQS